MGGNVNIEWEGPWRLRDFFGNDVLRERFSCAGVYLWIQHHDGLEELNYVGKASGSPTLYKRQLEHFRDCIGGRHHLPKPFRPIGTAWIPDPTTQACYSVLLDPTRFHGLIDDAYVMIDTFKVYLARTAVFPDPKKSAKLIERQLLFDLQPVGTGWGLGSPPSELVEIIHHNATWLTEPIEAHLVKHEKSIRRA
jgi:hypothetical protein